MNAAIKHMAQAIGRGLAPLALALPALSTAVPAADKAPAEARTVQIANFSFAPKTLTVAAGTTVTWVNRDDEAHTIASAANPRLFSSAPLDTGEKFSFTFTKPGTYQYFCAVHPYMTGAVVVK